MGYTPSFLRYIASHREIVKGKDILTLGVLYPYLSASEFVEIFPEFKHKDYINNKDNFSDYLFIHLLGANSVKSLDISDYQGADIIANLNLPIPHGLVNSFDVILDLGTLEHLSDVRSAVDNYFAILRQNGLYIFSAVMNNWSDHGFFQFSPTFFVDLVRVNRCLTLQDLHFAGRKYYTRISKPSSFLTGVLSRSTRQRITTIGTILLTDSASNISFDFIQSRYLELHSQRSKSSTTLNLRRTITNASLSLFANIPLPLDVKIRLFSSLVKATSNNRHKTEILRT